MSGGAFAFRHSQFANRIRQTPFGPHYGNRPLTLKPQDIVILLKMQALGTEPWSYSQLAYELGMSASEVHAGVKRAVQVGLMQARSGWGSPEPAALTEFLVHGVRYAFAPDVGGLVQGLPTAFWAAPLKDRVELSDEPPCVWPDEDGSVRGLAFSPLYRSVPAAARRDARLYELLVLVDALRISNAHRDIAVESLRERLLPASVATPRGMAQSRRGSHGKESQLHRR